MIGTALGMADDDAGCAGILQHFGGEIAGMRAGRIWVTILRADRDGPAPRLLGKARDQRGRRADQQVGLAGERAGARKHGLEFGHGGLQPVHFPVAGDQGPDAIVHVKFLTVGAASLAERREFGHIAVLAIPCPLTASNSPTRAWLRGGDGHFMMRYQPGDALFAEFA